MNKFGDFTDKQGGVNNSNHWLLGDPAFHATHRYTVNFVPKLYFFIGKMIITYKAAFEFENVGEDKSFFLEVEVSGFDDTIKHTVIKEIVAHRFPNNDINFSIEIAKTQHLNNILEPIFFNNFFHHENVLFLQLTVTIYHAVHLCCSCLCSEDGIKTEAPAGEVEDSFVSKKMLGIFDGLHVGVTGDRILECRF